ncbi:EpsG family protein [Clostridium sp.]|uniref:EpsG family protein n=1 Tax=Clostridium sp. TaxID=1506 RepID=UPI002FCA338C
MFYIIVFLILGYFSYSEFRGREYKYTSFTVVSAFITLIAFMRYGEGTDYFGYMFNYYITPSVFDFPTAFSNGVHGEIGFIVLSSLFRTFNISFEVFAGVMALCSMVLVCRFIKKYSKMPITSLTIFYVLYYLVYIFSGIRQGLAIAIFIGIGIDLYKKDKYKEFIILILFTATIHSSVLVTLLILPLTKYKVSYKFYAGIIALAALIMVSKVDLMLINLLPEFISSKVLIYWGEGSISMLAFANRATVLLLILFYSFGEQEDENVALFKKIYIIGFILYLVTIKSMTISSRISLYFKVFEIILIPNIIINLIKNAKRFKAIQLLGFTTIIISALLLKTLNAFLGEGDYLEHLSAIRYPYVSVFNKEKIWEYRRMDIHYSATQRVLREREIESNNKK